MRNQTLSSISLLVLLLNLPAFGQELSSREFLAMAERVYPDSKAPDLFGAGSASSMFAGEPEDPRWSSEMEARILVALEQERNQGLLFRRAEVECRTATCALLLIHAQNRADGSVGDLIKSLRESFGFSGVSVSEKEIPMQVTTAKGFTKTQFMLGYVEVLLAAARDADDDPVQQEDE